MKIKICGLKRLEDIEYINEADIDYAGFIKDVNGIISNHKDIKTSLNEFNNMLSYPL